MKNLINRALVAEKKLFLLLIPVLLGLTSCNKLTAEQAESAVMQGEIDRLPLVLQTIPFVDDITIDSIRLDIKDEPMHGFLFTTWKYKRKSTPIIVEVDSIHSSADRKGYIEWQSHWDNAARSYVMKSISF